MNMQTNIDDVRAEIIRLEAAPHFDAGAWSRVLADLSAAGRISALDDAKRRMETAKGNQPSAEYTCTLCGYHAAFDGSQTQIRCGGCGRTICLFKVGVDVASGPDETVSVAVETDYNADGKLKAYWVQRVEDEWGMWIHAESAGKAKSIYQSKDPSLERADFTSLRATRPARGADLLDCTPFTDYTLELAGYRYQNEGFNDLFLDFCPCSMCRYELTKPEYRVGIMANVEV